MGLRSLYFVLAGAMEKFKYHEVALGDDSPDVDVNVGKRRREVPHELDERRRSARRERVVLDVQVRLARVIEVVGGMPFDEFINKRVLAAEERAYLESDVRRDSAKIIAFCWSAGLPGFTRSMSAAGRSSGGRRPRS